MSIALCRIFQPLACLMLATAISACDSSPRDATVLAPVGVAGTQPAVGTAAASTGTSSTGSTGTALPGTGLSGLGSQTPVINGLPVALPDVAVVQLNSSNNPVNVLTNDSDPNGDALKITAVVFTLSVPPSATGSVMPSTDGLTLRYTPPQGFIGTQTVRYTISDGKGGVASALAVITVSPLPIPPVAVADVFTLKTDAAAVQLDVLANDLDGAGGGLTLLTVSSVTTVPTGGSGTLSVVNNRVQYRPKAGFIGVDTLLYTLKDANGATASGTVLITILPVAAPPVAVPDAITIAANNAVDIDVLANDVDLAGGGLTLTAVSAVTSLPPMSNGTFALMGNKVRYAPPSAGFVGTQTASYTLKDSNGQTATGVITIVVTANIPPTPPVAVPDVAILAGGTSSASLDVLTNDIDSAGGGLAITAASVATSVPMAAGLAAGSDGRKVQFAIPAGYVGVVTLTYTIKDANGSTSTAAVVVTVQPAALPPVGPVLVPDVATVAQDSPATLIDVLSNDVDAAGGGLTLTAASISNSVPAAAQVVDVSGSKVRFTPAAGFAGVVTVSYTARDANGSTANGTLSIVVTPKPVSLPPVAVADVATVSASAGPADIGVLANDIDTNGGGLSLTAASITAAVPTGAGTIAVVANTVRYTPSLAYTGLVTVSYTVTDAIGQTATGSLVITVTP